MATHVFTSVAANYIPKARVLAHSVKRFHPGFRFHVVVCDLPRPGLLCPDEPFESVVPVADLTDASRAWIFKHSLVELSTAVKGMMLEKLLRLPDCGEVLYFDPDIVVLNSLDKLMAEFDAHAVLLTPHQTEPEQTTEAVIDNEICSLKHGVYNLGFLGVKNSPLGCRFAKWWADRLREFCYADIPNGIFTDQRWMDLAPAFFDDLGILRDAVYNVCTWNLTHRTVTGNLPDGLLVNGEPLVFYHFSGFDSGAQEIMLQKYGARMPALWKLRKWYVDECARMGQEQYAAIPWAYGFFGNGRTVLPEHRSLYRGRIDLQRAFPDPFSTITPNSSYYHWFAANGPSVSNAVGPTLEDSAKITPLERFANAVKASYPAPYRIFLSVGQNEIEAALTTAASLLEHTQSEAPFLLIGPASVVAHIYDHAPAGHRLQPVPLAERSNHEDGFERVLRDFGDQDFAFVMAGVVVPDLWDLRLAWTAARVDGVASVSPVCDQIERPASDGGDLPVSQLDSIARLESDLSDPEIKQFLKECLFVRGEAVRAAANAPRSIIRRGDPFEAFGERVRPLRYSHILADHLCVRSTRPDRVVPPESIRGYLPESASASFLRRIATAPETSTASRRRVSPRLRSRSRNLHLMHNWGGGLDRWVQQYCRTDDKRDNLLVKPVGAWGAHGMQLDLYGSVDDPRPLESWILSPFIGSTARNHRGYRQALEEIVHRYGIDRIFVSSLIGHSLDAFDLGLPTLFICHDFYPWCPAINITFHGTCHVCGHGELTECTRENRHNRFFDNLPPQFWMKLRSDFLARVSRNAVLFVAPSDSARRHWCELVPELKDHFLLIPHGSATMERVPFTCSDDITKPLRVLVLGNIGPHKGRFLMEEIVHELRSFAEVWLLGCGADGAVFANLRGVNVIPTYNWADLPELVKGIQPDLGLLLSVYPETFCYTLQELFELGVPPLATRVGSFEERIHDGINGFLCEPNGASVLGRLRELSGDRGKLAEVRATLSRVSHRTLEEMVADYEAILQAPAFSSRAYFLSPDGSAGPVTSQLFWLTHGTDFDEAMSSRVRTMPTPDTIRLRLPVAPQPEPITRLRLDLANRPGLVLLKFVRVYDADNTLVWASTGPELVKEECFSGMIPVAGSAADNGQLIFLTNHEPMLLLSTGREALQRIEKGGVVEVECSWPLPASYPHAVQQLFRGEGARELQPAELETILGQLAADTSRLRAEKDLRRLAGAQERIASLENSWSWRVTAPLRWLGRCAGLARLGVFRTRLSR